MSSQRSFMLNKKKVTEVASLKVDAGQVGIWKAPLPLGTAELKMHSLTNMEITINIPYISIHCNYINTLQINANYTNYIQQILAWHRIIPGWDLNHKCL